MPEADWSNQIERALRDAAERDDFGVLVIQWVQTGLERPQTETRPKRGGAESPGRAAGR
jgi:hypothetical protein